MSKYEKNFVEFFQMCMDSSISLSGTTAFINCAKLSYVGKKYKWQYIS